MTSTRFPLLAALCLVLLTGCDAMGPEPASATATKSGPVIEDTMPASSVMVTPGSLKLGAECVIRVISDDRVAEWHTSRGLEIGQTRPDRAQIRSTAAEGKVERILAITDTGERIMAKLIVKEDGDTC